VLILSKVLMDGVCRLWVDHVFFCELMPVRGLLQVLTTRSLQVHWIGTAARCMLARRNNS
jgi:hypothetical protein